MVSVYDQGVSVRQRQSVEKAARHADHELHKAPPFFFFFLVFFFKKKKDGEHAGEKHHRTSLDLGSVRAA